MAEEEKPIAYAIQNGDGFWVGIWTTLEMAQHVLDRGLKSNKEIIVPLYAKPPAIL